MKMNSLQLFLLSLLRIGIAHLHLFYLYLFVYIPLLTRFSPSPLRSYASLPRKERNPYLKERKKYDADERRMRLMKKKYEVDGYECEVDRMQLRVIVHHSITISIPSLVS
ncbi:hypothetical protein L2E82_02075 [Cichorium intybus]|uniref:Uncharacterized protein n=1 Tax=Cichorium intybus TaxID=13427 RepID=A0ACB9H1F5_CICIN|nr:hypothetical protein L2E82_02075 [Cichorium intybus]